MDDWTQRREVIERLLFGDQRRRRFTQDSPILPDVWLAFGKEPEKAHELLLTPHRDVSAGRLAKALKERLEDDREIRTSDAGDRRDEARSTASPWRVAHIQGNVVARIDFLELIRVVLPMTPWWQRYVWLGTGDYLRQVEKKQGRAFLADALRAFEDNQPDLKLSTDLLWIIRLIGVIGRARRGDPNASSPKTEEAPGAREISSEVASLIEGLTPPERNEERLVWRVNRNRPANLVIHRSALAVKADAARQLFDISCREISWAVIDSGIDAEHLAFRRRDEEGKPYLDPFAKQRSKWRNFTRVAATYDFTLVRDLLDPSGLDESVLPEPIRNRLKARGASGDRLREEIGLLRLHLQTGRDVDWGLLAPLLEIPNHAYRPPQEGHGTHVAGILAADWHDPEEPMIGVCPDIKLYDFRVLDDRGRGDEFSVIAALQFLRYLNATRDHFVVHGANLSLSIRHDVSNYACGRTPVCEDCERVVSSGVVVVAAAGNDGYLEYQTSRGLQQGYHTVSITDPGNAEEVITVGATHRYRPHEYGVSYFSSRGPTGDGRLKPDLVAPGEKVTGPLPGNDRGRRDGTSMAAPHVSGAAALLMARHRELVGSPHRIKEILCATATDLGRERYFQGCGMVDALRALQHV